MTRALVTQLLNALQDSWNPSIDSLGREAKAKSAIKAARDYLATEPIGERAELIQWLRERGACDGMLQLSEAAEMLEADAQEIERTRKMYEKAHQGRADFRQAFREARKAQPSKRVPMTAEQITEMATQEQFLLVCDGLEELTQIVRSTEQHHDITPADKATDWSAV